LNEELRLIRKIQRTGDRDAADRLVRGYYDEIYRYVARQTPGADTAMDITQNVFISMLRTIGNFDGKRAGFRTWLYKIATYKTIDYFRSRRADIHRCVDFSEVDFVDEKEFTRDLETEERLRAALSYVGNLDIELQEIFRLKLFAEYTFRQIAEILGCPESTVKTKYYQMLKDIREEFKGE
jgi:RNA polymerase sigma-70 factor (ECF subfamily)